MSNLTDKMQTEILDTYSSSGDILTDIQGIITASQKQAYPGLII